MHYCAVNISCLRSVCTILHVSFLVYKLSCTVATVFTDKCLYSLKSCSLYVIVILFAAAGSSIQDGIEYITRIVGGQFTEQEMIEALQHTKINPMDALNYLLTKGT